MPDLPSLVADLSAEHEDLDVILTGLDEEAWRTPTPAAGWDVRDQVGHIAFFDARARLAVTDPAGFAASLVELAADPEGFVEHHLDEARSSPGSAVLAGWRAERARMAAALRSADPAARVPWYGPPMSPASFITARLMETWAHGQDVADALGVEREPTARLRHIAHLGIRARPFNYSSHAMEMPAAGVRVELAAPDGDTWTWGEPEWSDRVRGDALDFCLVVTQRRHRADTDLVVEGEAAEEWVGIAQAFAGPPGPGRRPGQFPRRTARR